MSKFSWSGLHRNSSLASDVFNDSHRIHMFIDAVTKHVLILKTVPQSIPALQLVTATLIISLKIKSKAAAAFSVKMYFPAMAKLTFYF